MKKNEITGDTLINKPTNDKYREGWDRIFGDKKKKETEKEREECLYSWDNYGKWGDMNG